MDLPGFAKFAIEGAGAADWLDHLITGRVPRAGRVALSYLCSPRGTIVSEMTVSHVQPGLFWLVSGAAAERHDEEWLRSHLSLRHGPVTITNVTSRFGSLIIAGPRSRELLSRLTDVEVSNGAFPWLAVRRIPVALASAIAIRASYSGELGWELHVPIEHLAALYAALLVRGQDLGLRHFGLYALESLRLEKCYRSWKVDLTSDYTPLASSLERFVRFDKTANFIGREALQLEQAAGPRERFVPLLVDASDADAAAISIVHHGRDAVGTVTSGGYGYRLNRSIALAYVRADLAAPGVELEVEILGERRRAVVAREPLYDPANLRLRA
jgi:dimethylglycine dehydrogenase